MNCARGHDNWYTRPNGDKYCRECSNASKRARRGHQPLDPTLCRNRLHPRAAGECAPCLEARRAREDARRKTLRKGRRNDWLWEDGAAEFYWLRDQGFTLRDIAAKAGIKWQSLQMAMYRRGIPWAE